MTILKGVQVPWNKGRKTGKPSWNAGRECPQLSHPYSAASRAGSSAFNKSRATHGLAGAPEYAAYHQAKLRCEDPLNKDFKRYGARGIRFLFDSFEQWLAELGRKPSPAHSVDRRDNGGHYEPGNVRWATRSEQRRNQRRKAA